MVDPLRNTLPTTLNTNNISTDPNAIAGKIISDNGGKDRANLTAIKKAVETIKARDAELGAQVETAVKAGLKTTDAGRLDATAYSIRLPNGTSITIDPNALTPAQQRLQPVGSADRNSYGTLDRLFGDGRWATDDSAKISTGLQEAIANGMSPAQYSALIKAQDKKWTAQVADFMGNFTPDGLALRVMRPAIDALLAGPAKGTEWGASLQSAMNSASTISAFQSGMREGVLNGAESLVVGLATVVGKGAQLAADTSPIGWVGDYVRSVTPDSVKGWLRDRGLDGAANAAVPSARRGEQSIDAMVEMGRTVKDYFANRTPGQVADDIGNAVSAKWDSLKSEHAKVAAQGPEAEARWWGQIVGRTAFEVASTLIPVAGQAGKIAKGAEVVDTVADGARALGAGEDIIRAGDKVVDGVRKIEKLSETIEIGGKLYQRYTGNGPLFRGDGRAPGEIFSQGFRPKGTATDLAEYVAKNTESVYVSTSTSVDVARGPAFSGPGKFVYEIDATAIKNAGVDVNKSLGKHGLSHEMEVAVPGGVSSGAIKSARQVMADGNLGPKIPNPNFGK